MENETRLRQWLEEARAGDDEATRGIETVVRQISHQVGRGGTAALLGGVDWEDVAQEALLRLLGTRTGYRGTGSARGYIYSTVKTSLLQALRSARRREKREARFSSEMGPFSGPGAPTANAVSGAPRPDGTSYGNESGWDTRRVAEEILSTLEPTCRELVERVFFEGAPYELLARESGKAESSIRAQLSRCLRRARERSR